MLLIQRRSYQLYQVSCFLASMVRYLHLVNLLTECLLKYHHLLKPSTPSETFEVLHTSSVLNRNNRTLLEEWQPAPLDEELQPGRKSCFPQLLLSSIAFYQ